MPIKKDVSERKKSRYNLLNGHVFKHLRNDIVKEGISWRSMILNFDLDASNIR
jgi:hypothetical protein